MNQSSLYAALSASAAILVSWGLAINLAHDSLKTTANYWYALKMIESGDDPQKYRLQIQDAKTDGLAGLLMGGRKRLFKAFHKRKESLATA